MGVVSIAETELVFLSKDDPDAMQREVNRHILETVKLFADEGISDSVLVTPLAYWESCYDTNR